MPSSGKSTLAKGLAQTLGWLCIDTDSLLEAWYGVTLEELKNRFGNTTFLKAEEQTICTLSVTRCVIATGGSVVYSPQAMDYLKTIGLVVYLKIDYQTLVRRISEHPNRGLIIQSGQNMADIHKERTPLYELSADVTLQTDHHSLHQCIQTIQEWYYDQLNTTKQTL
jgi:shikimate kinase